MYANKISHENPAVISDIINKVKKHIVELSILIGNKHTILDMNIEVRDNIIQVDMVKKLKECKTIFVEDISTSVSSPETKKLFEVR